MARMKVDLPLRPPAPKVEVSTVPLPSVYRV
jgi:hypothetical protein